MTLCEFNALDEMEQAKAAWDAVSISERRDQEHNILLYQRDNFYFEVFHHREYNVIRRIRAFKNVEPAGWLLGQIDITKLNSPGITYGQ